MPKRRPSRIRIGIRRAGLLSPASFRSSHPADGRILRMNSTPPRDQAASQDEPNRHQDSRQNARSEQIGDADAADERVEDQRDRRRDQDVDDRRRGVVGRAQPGRIALPFLPRDEHRSEGAGIGDRASRDTAEDDRGHDRGRERAPAPALHRLGGEVQEFLAELAAQHQAARHHEEGQGEHRKGLRLLVHLLRDDHQRQIALPRQASRLRQ